MDIPTQLERLASELKTAATLSTLKGLTSNIWIQEVTGTGDDTRISGTVTVSTHGGYSFKIRFENMSVTTVPGSRSGGKFEIENDRSLKNFASGLIMEMVGSDKRLFKYIHPSVER